jgi:hypothetical protein
MGYTGIIDLRAQCIDFPEEFLDEKIELSADRHIFFKKGEELLDMAAESDYLLGNIRFISQDGNLLGKTHRIKLNLPQKLFQPLFEISLTLLQQTRDRLLYRVNGLDELLQTGMQIFLQNPPSSSRMRSHPCRASVSTPSRSAQISSGSSDSCSRMSTSG